MIMEPGDDYPYLLVALRDRGSKYGSILRSTDWEDVPIIPGPVLGLLLDE